MTTIIECDVPAPVVIPDFRAIKARQQAVWSCGDYAAVGTTLQIVGEELAEVMDLRPGQKVLDVAAGNGNVTLAAARRWCEVTSTDYVEGLLQRGRLRAEAEGLHVEFQQADAESLPFADGTFDAVVSTFGVMFTPDQARSASEMLRVLKSGGHIGLANWTPDGFIGQMFKIIGQYLPPPTGIKSPTLWGTKDWLERAFHSEASKIAIEHRHFRFRYRSAEHFLEFFRTHYGPMLKAFEALEERTSKALVHDILDIIARFNASRDSTMIVPSEYLEVVIAKR